MKNTKTAPRFPRLNIPFCVWVANEDDLSLAASWMSEYFPRALERAALRAQNSWLSRYVDRGADDELIIASDDESEQYEEALDKLHIPLSKNKLEKALREDERIIPALRGLLARVAGGKDGLECSEEEERLGRQWHKHLSTYLAQLSITPQVTPRERVPIFLAYLRQGTLKRKGLVEGCIRPLLSLEVWDYCFETLRVSRQLVRRPQRLRRCDWKECRRFFEVKRSTRKYCPGKCRDRFHAERPERKKAGREARRRSYAKKKAQDKL